MTGASSARSGAADRELRLPLGPAPSSDTGRGLVRIPPERMAALGLRPGDTVAVVGTRRTHARAMPNTAASDRAGADAVLAANAGASWGSAVTLTPAALDELACVTLDSPTPLPPAVADMLADLTVTEGDTLRLSGPSDGHTVVVRELAPAAAGRVGPRTEIRRARTPRASAPGYDGVGGLAAQIAAVHEIVELPLLRPDLFERLGMDPPRGVLFTGPPGSGKTLLARAVARKSEATFLHLAGPEIVSKHYGESERALRELFETAARRAPAIIFLDEIDAIAPRRESLSGEKQVERRIVGQLLTLLDGLEPRDRVVVMAATNLPSALDPALRRPGRFDREIRFAPPDAAGRTEILSLHLSRAPLAPDADVAAIAERSHGYVGADLAALAREAGLSALSRAVASGDAASASVDAVRIEQSDLEAGLARTRPSALRDDTMTARPIGWGDIGGLDAAKAALIEAVIWPLTHAAAVRRLGLSPPRGILLAGPPGGGKTMLVRALAHESGANFLPARPERLLSQFLGEAERAISDLFLRARQAAPSLVFFDELDALAPRRGGDATLGRLVAQLLSEMDGLEDNRAITVVAATNRAADIDPALTRPGRFDLVVAIGLPDSAEREEILAVHLRGRPLAEGVSLADLAAETEGMSGAGLASLVARAARTALARAISGEPAHRDRVEIERPDFDRALATIRHQSRTLATSTLAEGGRSP